jgi:hypothetical protein
MPWKETDAMQERIRLVFEWERRWKELRGTVNMSELCREFGVSRECGGKTRGVGRVRGASARAPAPGGDGTHVAGERTALGTSNPVQRMVEGLLMVTVESALKRFRENPTHSRPGAMLRVESTLGAPASPDEISEVSKGPGALADLVALWRVCRSARLFADIDYSQWGLVLLDPEKSARRTQEELVGRPSDMRRDDVVIGEFLGDQELLVVAPSENDERRILVALPLDPRSDWFAAAPSLGEFLERYFDACGDKYWEPNSRS